MMTSITNIFSLARIGMINLSLMGLALKLKRSHRTYLSYATLYSLINNYSLLEKQTHQPLHVAEFGVGRGGSATILAWLTNHYQGKLSLYDLFGRIPAPSKNDGEKAINRYEYIVKHEDENYYGNIDNLLEVISQELYGICDPERIEFIPGKYEDVLGSLGDERVFNLVHIDCDWYESSKVVYTYLKQRLAPGAVIQIDDYSNWEGSKRAFQEASWLATYQTHIVDGALVIDTSKNK